MKKEINVAEQIPHIMAHLARGGILATVKVGEKVNPITIGWGTFGTQWGKPLFQIYVRECRYSKSMLDQAGEFTINVPLAFDERTKEILTFCGMKSGRDVDKIAALNLSLVKSEKISTPGLRELPMTLECKIIYSTRQNGAAMPAEILNKYYPNWAECKEDVHTVYYGEIVSAYVIE